MNINEIIEQLKALDVNTSGIKAALKKKGFSPEEIEEALPITARRTFASDFYDWLVEAPRTEEEVEAFILGTSEYGETSKNVQNHLSHYKNIADLARRVREAV